MSVPRGQGGHVLDVFNPRCQSRSTLQDVTGRWGTLTLLAMAEGRERFGDLHRHIGGSNERMLSQTLGVLTADGLVHRKLDPTGRPYYVLTAGGRMVAERLSDLREAIYLHVAASAREFAEGEAQSTVEPDA